jgi:hypothetical protein
VVGGDVADDIVMQAGENVGTGWRAKFTLWMPRPSIFRGQGGRGVKFLLP